MPKLDLPSNGTLSDIAEYYTTLYNTANKTTTGNVRFPTTGTTRAGYVYDTSTSINWVNQGQIGMLNLLLYGDPGNGSYSNPKMENYLVFAEDINALNSKVDVVLAGGTATAITLTLSGVSEYTSYSKFTFIAANSNSAQPTSININSLGARNLYKPNTTDAPNIIAGKAYTVWYNGTDFFLQASAEGTAVAGDVLAGVTFSNDSDAGISGTLSLTGTAAIGDVLSGTTFYNTNAKTKLTGTLALSGDADAASVLTGKTFYNTNAKTKVTGTMPNRAGDTAALSSTVAGTTLKLLASNGYRDGTDDYVTITDADFVAGNIKNGVNLFGLSGNYEGLKIISRQYGTQAITSSTTNQSVTISSINTANSVVFHTSYGTSRNERMRCDFVSSTSFNMYRTATTSYSHTEQWEVIEFDPNCINSIQTGIVSGSNPNTVTISSVNINKSMLFYGAGGGGTGTMTQEYGKIVDSTTITLHGDSGHLWRWFVVEFK